MAGTRKVIAAAAMAVALLVLAVVPSEAGDDCGVDEGKAASCLPFCAVYSRQPWATPSAACCKALEGADFKCLCKKYRSELESGSSYAHCAMEIPPKCGIKGAPKSC